MAEENLMTDSEFAKRDEAITRREISLATKTARSAGKVASAKIKKLKTLQKVTKPSKVFSRKIKPKDVDYTYEQAMLRKFFGGYGDPLWGTGRDLPKLHNTLNSGGGILKSGDRGETRGVMIPDRNIPQPNPMFGNVQRSQRVNSSFGGNPLMPQNQNRKRRRFTI